ncbi:Histidine kinase-like ATPase, ATP-binding domain-containing protein [Artemisia annua]|uniref:Histidine kinase-like ATPase, ATP-binding domain-containing protein n=1 Tax=Artemisia annua TaxID=35608 RepID=A0A2U1MXX0_ARTAN|nr:Histidine kinase-like ATPase, ATP-binding domain-containing protein [Artemisia annua]
MTDVVITGLTTDLFFGPLTRDDVVVELHILVTVPIIHIFDVENLATSRLTLWHSGDKKLAEKLDLQLVHRHKIGNMENFGIYHEGMSYNEQRSSYGTESVVQSPLGLSVARETNFVIEALKETNFVSAGEQSGYLLYKRINLDLFDPGDSLLTSLFSDEAYKFPGERFVSDVWLQILRTIGLQDTHDADILLKCAKK